MLLSIKDIEYRLYIFGIGFSIERILLCLVKRYPNFVWVTSIPIAKSYP